MTDVTTDLSPEEAEIRNFVKKQLNKRLFLGQYQERRYVDSRKVYRDIIVLHKTESELQYDIERVQSKLNSFYQGQRWLGITRPDTIGAPAAGHCFWTKLQDVAFGFYWFQIRKIHFEENAVEVRLKVIRQVKEEVFNPAAAAPAASFSKTFADNVDTLKSCFKTSIHSLKESQCPSSEQDIKQESSSKPSESVPGDEKEKKEESTAVPKNQTSTLEDMKVLGLVAVHHWREIFMFVSAAIVGTINGLARCVEYIGNFSLKLMHEFSFLMGTITPIILAVIELVGKIIGGLYLLIAMMFRQNGPSPQQIRRPQLQYERPSPQPFRRPNRPPGYERI